MSAFPFHRVVHCDWSVAPAKRWLACANRTAAGWQVQAPAPVGDTASLLARLGSGVAGPVLVGFDFPLGLPQRYAEQLPFRNFPHALGAFGSGAWAEFFTVAQTPAQIALQRPFYPQRGTGARRQHLVDGLGIDTWQALLRRCERATADRPEAASLFWTVGGQQVGKAAIAGWREVIVPALGEVALWPFDGDLDACRDKSAVVLCETYPGDTYGRLGIARWPRWSKQDPIGRLRAAPALRTWLGRHAPASDPAVCAAIDAGFGPGSRGEDPFDALVGLLGMLDVVDGRRSEGPVGDPVVRQWEGWILGQAAPALPSGLSG